MPGDERVLDFSVTGVHLAISLEQLIVKRDGADDVSIPLSDTAIAVISGAQVTCTGAALAGLMRHGGALIVCDGTHLPVGLMLPLGTNNEQTRRVVAQARTSKPTCKRLWKQIVREKVLSQMATLTDHRGHDYGLRSLARDVRSGDPANIEGQASRIYWPALFDDVTFRRRREAADQNRLLNYGYAVLRAAMGRMVCAAGLHPSLGVHHHGRNNAWVLADDLMEPYRPLIDDVVCQIVGEHGVDVPLDGSTKTRLIETLYCKLDNNGERRTVLDSMHRTAASLARVFLGDAKRLFFPQGLRDVCADT